MLPSTYVDENCSIARTLEIDSDALILISDKIRDGLKGLGYEVEDLPGGKSVAKKK